MTCKINGIRFREWKREGDTLYAECNTENLLLKKFNTNRMMIVHVDGECWYAVLEKRAATGRRTQLRLRLDHETTMATPEEGD